MVGKMEPSVSNLSPAAQKIAAMSVPELHRALRRQHSIVTELGHRALDGNDGGTGDYGWGELHTAMRLAKQLEDALLNRGVWPYNEPEPDPEPVMALVAA